MFSYFFKRRVPKLPLLFTFGESLWLYLRSAYRTCYAQDQNGQAPDLLNFNFKKDTFSSFTEPRSKEKRFEFPRGIEFIKDLRILRSHRCLPTEPPETLRRVAKSLFGVHLQDVISGIICLNYSVIIVNIAVLFLLLSHFIGEHLRNKRLGPRSVNHCGSIFVRTLTCYAQDQKNQVLEALPNAKERQFSPFTERGSNRKFSTEPQETLQRVIRFITSFIIHQTQFTLKCLAYCNTSCVAYTHGIGNLGFA